MNPVVHCLHWLVFRLLQDVGVLKFAGQPLDFLLYPNFAQFLFGMDWRHRQVESSIEICAELNVFDEFFGVFGQPDDRQSH